MKSRFFLLLMSATCYSTVIPPEPSLWNKPDSIYYYNGDQLEGAQSLTYNADGYVTRIFSKTNEFFDYANVTITYSRNKDTVTSIDTFDDFDEPSKETYILDNQNRVVKSIIYFDNEENNYFRKIERNCSLYSE